MLKLRNILLHNTVFIIILLIGLIITTIRFLFPKESIYTNKTTSLTAIVKNYVIDGDKLSITMGKEKVLGTYYFKTELEKNTFIKEISLGDTYKIKGEFSLPKEPTTTNLFNYKNYLKSKNINYLVSIKTIEKVSNNKNIYYHTKNFIQKRLHNNPYLYTFILGDKSYVSSDVMKSYQENGISHLFAISGMHITLLSTILLKILSKLKVTENKRYLITSIILIYYLLLVGLSPSILRGVLFFILFSLNKIYYFYIKSTNLYIVALTITLLINPYYIYDSGFLYSFTISLALLLSINYINSKNYFISLLKTSFISFLGSLPISLYNYNQINLLSIFYNLFFVPFVSIVIFPLSLISVICPFILPIFNAFIFLLEKISILLNQITILKLIFYKENILLYIFYFLLIFFIIIRLNQKKKSYISLLCIILIIHYHIPNIIHSNYIKMIDVGQGDSIILHSKNETILFDTGGVPTYSNELWRMKNKTTSIVENTTIPLLKSLGIKKIDYLILTHGDYDHLGEALNLIKNYKVKTVILNNNKVNYLESKIRNTFKNTIIGEEGLSIKCGDINLIQLNSNLNDENDSSQMYYAIYKDVKMLFTGDASIKSEKYLLDKYTLENIDILKVGHHGSRTSTSDALLSTLQPKFAIISLGKDNKFGHPHEETINRLNKYNVKYYRTDISGTITINLDNNKVIEDKK